MGRNIRVVVVNGENIYTKTIKNELEPKQRIVGGLIDVIETNIPTKNNNRVIDLVVNDEGLLLGLPQNPKFPRIAGTVFLSATDLTTGDSVDLSNKDIENIYKYLKE